jgi:hypothetical protein
VLWLALVLEESYGASEIITIRDITRDNNNTRGDYKWREMEGLCSLFLDPPVDRQNRDNCWLSLCVETEWRKGSLEVSNSSRMIYGLRLVLILPWLRETGS